ncbi:MAG: HAMP domain-containing sensor histidine kinase [Chitinophagaceae bacterium]
MNRSIRLILIVCITAVAGVMLLQSLWVSNYYEVNKERFEKEANLAFEDAIKTEFKLRCDTIETLVVDFLMDTSQIDISSRWHDTVKTYVYTISNGKMKNDKRSFSIKHFSKPILSPQDTSKRIVAQHYAETLRREDLENHYVYYRTQNLGDYIGKKAEQFSFDTARLRPVYQKALAGYGIKESFTFYLRDKDSTVNKSIFPDSLTKLYPVITKSFPTYKVEPGKNFVRAMFHAPVNYLLGKMAGMIIASAILLIIVAFSLFYMLRIIRREKKLSAIKNDFISNISHELKTPIATVHAAIDAMDGFGALDNPVKTKRYLDISRNELQRLSDMVNKILNLSLYERQDFELKPEQVNITTLVDEITGSHLLADNKKIHFNFTNNAGTDIVKADKIHLYNVVNNLIDNAVKYSGDTVTIDIRFFREKDHFVIAVQDNGIGISRNDLPFIFDRFYRVPSGNIHKVKGYGLGLSYVKLIMEKHGGWCMAESKPGYGSTFKLALQA